MKKHGILSLGEADSATVDELRADLIRSAARGQGPTFIAAKLDKLIAKVRREPKPDRELLAWQAVIEKTDGRS